MVRTLTKPRDTRPIYTRFVCYNTVAGQRYRLGLFQAIDHATQSDHSEKWALDLMWETYDWFRKNLKTPDRFETGGWSRKGNPALCWYKPDAQDHIRRMHDLKLALEACAIHVEVLTTRDVGQVLYEDAHQVAAVPNRHTF